MKKTAILFLLSIIFLVPNTKAEAFNDVAEEHFNGEAIEFLKDSKIVAGYSDGSYKPENRINRAEFTKIIIEATYSDDEIEGCDIASFSDVPADQWFSKYICMAKKHSVVSGYPNHTFRPAGFINFAEASKIIAEAQNVEEDTSGTNNEWFAGYVKGLQNRNAIPSTIQFFDKEITRGEMSELIFRLKKDRRDKVSSTYKEITDPFPAITSCDALEDKFEEYWSRDYRPTPFFDNPMMMEMEPVPTKDAISGGSGRAKGISTSYQSGVADDFSQTNIQVAGVDEADIIKNDGKFIYMIKDDTVRIIEAYPPSKMSEIAYINFEDDYFYPSELYITDNEMVVIGQSLHYYYMESEDEIERLSITPPYYDEDQTIVYIFDISDRSNPDLMRKVSYDGFYKSSRRINNQLYLVLNIRPNAWSYDDTNGGESLLPMFRDGNKKPEVMADCTNVHYFPGHNKPQYLITTSIQIDDPNSKIHRNVFLGSSDNIYSSRTHLYVASTVVDQDRYTDWNWSRDKTKTHIFRFALEDGEINFKARGEVPGRILNQFSMDAYIDNFRIATTTGSRWNDDDPSGNNVYVLNNNMKIIGSLEGVAKGEHIYSTRFLGERLYMVTFKNIDPLFVINLANPTDPVVLGKLKIPGYSEYLHPYDANHIIGFGQEVTENEWGGVVTDGFKMSLFDVSDVKNPKQKFVEHIGEKGTYSELLNNHKALLFDKEKDLLAFPITIQEKVNYSELQCGLYDYDTCPNDCQVRCIPSDCHKDEDGISVCTDDCNGLGSCTESDYDRYKTSFSGAVVYDLNLKDGFTERGRITHMEEGVNEDEYYNFDYDKNIERIIQIGKYLYTTAKGGIKASTLDTVRDVKFIELEY